MILYLPKHVETKSKYTDEELKRMYQFLVDSGIHEQACNYIKKRNSFWYKLRKLIRRIV